MFVSKVILFYLFNSFYLSSFWLSIKSNPWLHRLYFPCSVTGLKLAPTSQPIKYETKPTQTWSLAFSPASAGCLFLLSVLIGWGSCLIFALLWSVVLINWFWFFLTKCDSVTNLALKWDFPRQTKEKTAKNYLAARQSGWYEELGLHLDHTWKACTKQVGVEKDKSSIAYAPGEAEQLLGGEGLPSLPLNPSCQWLGYKELPSFFFLFFLFCFFFLVLFCFFFQSSQK